MVVQVCMHTCAELVASVPFLEDAEDDFVRYLVTQLHPTVQSLLCYMFLNAGACCLHCVHIMMLLPDCIVCTQKVFCRCFLHWQPLSHAASISGITLAL